MYILKNRLYSLITKSLGLLLMRCKDQTPYITDDLGGDFKKYLSNSGYENIRDTFVKGFDSLSLEEFDILENRFLNLPNKSNVKLKVGYSLKWLFYKNPLDARKTSLERNFDLKRLIYRLICFWKYPKMDIEDSVFFYKHGLVFLPVSVKEYIRGSEYLDIGTFHGDSIISLNSYGFSGIHGFDISRISLNRALTNLKLAGIQSKNIKLNCAFVGAKSSVKLNIIDSGQSDLKPTLFDNSEEKEGRYTVETISIDDYFKNSLKPVRLIKADVEGALLEVIKGGEKTIVKNRPILLLAVYHNPTEFFEVKNLLQGWNLDYHFILKKLTHRRFRNASHIETFLLVVPEKLMR